MKKKILGLGVIGAFSVLALTSCGALVEEKDVHEENIVTEEEYNEKLNAANEDLGIDLTKDFCINMKMDMTMNIYKSNVIAYKSEVDDFDIVMACDYDNKIMNMSYEGKAGVHGADLSKIDVKMSVYESNGTLYYYLSSNGTGTTVKASRISPEATTFTAFVETLIDSGSESYGYETDATRYVEYYADAFANATYYIEDNTYTLKKNNNIVQVTYELNSYSAYINLDTTDAAGTIQMIYSNADQSLVGYNN